VGAEPQLVDVSRLPSFSAYADSNSDDLRRAELEKETWLSRPVTLYGYDPKGLNLPEGKVLPPEPDGTPFDKDKSAARSGLALPKGFLIRESVLDPTTMAMDEEALSVVELARGPLNPESKVQGTFRARQILDPASHALPVAAFEEGASATISAAATSTAEQSSVRWRPRRSCDRASASGAIGCSISSSTCTRFGRGSKSACRLSI
jgi:hypothetical protein